MKIRTRLATSVATAGTMALLCALAWTVASRHGLHAQGVDDSFFIPDEVFRDAGVAPAAPATTPAAADDGGEAAVAVEAAAAPAALGDGEGGLAPAEADAPPAVEPRPEELDANEQVRRREMELMAEHLVIEAMKAWRQDKFREAIKAYEDAKARLERASLSEPRIVRRTAQVKDAMTKVYEDWATFLEKEAQDLANADKVDEAIEKIQAAAELNPARQPEYDQKKRALYELKREVELRDLIRPAHVDIDKIQRDFDVEVLFEQGMVFYRNQRYADARDLFEQILLKDPYEVRAIRQLNRISDRFIEVAHEKHATITRERLAEVAWKWAEPVTPLLAGPGAPTVGRVVRKTEETGIRAKLDNIRIPEIRFDDVPIPDVIEVLKRRSRELDPDGEGVNIFLRLAPPGAESAATASTPAAAPGFGEPAAAPGGFGAEPAWGGFGDDAAGGFGAPAAAPATGGGVMQRTITMNMDNIPLGEVIRYICMGAGLKSRIESHAVIIADQSVPFETLETRFYPVEAGVLDAERTRSGNLAIGEGDAWGGGAAADGGAAQVDLQEFFTGLGVDFPADSKISYFQRTGRLIVHNTPENLRKLERVLQEINVTPTQVTIEAKFIEVAQNKLNSLGFDWLLLEGGVVPRTDPVTGKVVMEGNGPVWSSGGNQAGLQKDARFTRGLRFASNLFEGMAEGSDEIFGAYSIIGDLAFQTIIHALQQQKHADVLSAPKVTTLSGNTALLKMVEKRFIAVSWTEPELTPGSDTQGASFTPSIAETEEREFGVTLEVTPTVAADGYSIDLELMPRVEAFLGYDDRFNYKMVVDGEEVEAKQLTPIMSERSVATKVIIWDGETVVLGGMIGERITSWDDKVPLLGDIPLLGRLFKSTGEQTEKTNLIIFVTARLVNPAGLPVRANEVRGLPDFRR